MKKLIFPHAWWLTLVIGLAMLIAHTFSFKLVKVDNISIILLLVILLSPFISAITKIKYGDFEAEIDPKEVQKIRSDVSAQVSTTDSPTQNPEIELTVTTIIKLVESDPILALAKLRIELEKVLNRLYRITHEDVPSKKYVPLGQIVQTLTNEEIIPREVAHSTREVISICSRAIHGEDIRQQDAKSVAESGVSLLTKLHFYASNYVLDIKDSMPIDKEALDDLWNAQYRVTTVVPLTEDPYKNIRFVNQEGLNELLNGYSDYGEFIIEVKMLDKATI